jgi:hypothetical protein
MKGRFLELLIIVGILSVFALLVQPLGHRLSKTQIEQFQSNSQLKGIAGLVLDYESKHGGKAPSNLNQLVPDDRTDLLSTFCAPNDSKSQKPIGWSTNKANLDEWSDYALPSQPNDGIVAFEKGELWPDRTVAVCFTNITVERMSISNFEALLNTNNSRN